MLMNGKKDFEEDETYVFVQCANYDSMCCMDKFYLCFPLSCVIVLSLWMRII